MELRLGAFGALLALSLGSAPLCAQEQPPEERPSALESISQGAAAAPAARSVEDGWKSLDTAWNGGLAVPAVNAGPGKPLRPVTASSRRVAVIGPAAEAASSIAERREKLQARRAPAKLLGRAAGGLLGFAAGVAAGWLIGAVGAGAFVMKAPNPTVHAWRWVLLLPAVVLGAVVGELAMPFVLGYVFSKAETYPTKGLPEGQHHA